MQRDLKELTQTPMLRPQMDRDIFDPRQQYIAYLRNLERRDIQNRVRPNRAMQEERRSIEKQAEEDLRRRRGEPRTPFGGIIGNSLPWMSIFAKMKPAKVWEEVIPASSPFNFNFHPHFGCPEPQAKLEYWQAVFGTKKDQSTQTNFEDDPCPLCVAMQYNRFHCWFNFEPRPSVVDPAKCNRFTREVAVECPDTNFYDSSQLVFFRVGKYVYRGWTYLTPGGKIELMPRNPMRIHVNHIRNEPSPRTRGFN